MAKSVVVILGVVFLAGLGVPELRAQPAAASACDPGAIEHASLFEAGTASPSEVTGARATATSFSISMRTLYSLSLRLDKQWVDEAVASHQGEEIEALFKKDDVFKAVREGSFPKALVITFPYGRPAKELKKNIEKKLKPSGQHRSVAGQQFLKAFKGKFEEGDEAVIRIACGEELLLTVNNELRARVRDGAFARAILGVWVSPKEYASLLGEIKEALQTAAKAKEGESPEVK